MLHASVDRYIAACMRSCAEGRPYHRKLGGVLTMVKSTNWNTGIQSINHEVCKGWRRREETRPLVNSYSRYNYRLSGILLVCHLVPGPCRQ
jgi:hypothetical protein